MNFRPILSSSQVKTLSHYLGYLLILWIIHLVFISFVSFFHFQLNHRISVIEEWAFKNAWQLAIFSKLLACWAMMRFILVKSDQRIFKRIWDASLEWWKVPDYIYVAITFFLAFVLLNGRPEVVTVREFSIFSTLISGLGTIIFFGTDLLVLFFLRQFYPMRRGEMLFSVLALSVVFCLGNRAIYIYTQGIDSSALLFFLLLYFFSVLEKRRFVFPLLFLLVLSPLAAFFGVDLLWGDGQSYLQMTRKITFSTLLVSAIMVVNYISIKRIGWRPYCRYLRLLTWSLVYRPLVKMKRRS